LTDHVVFAYKIKEISPPTYSLLLYITAVVSIYQWHGM